MSEAGKRAAEFTIPAMEKELATLYLLLGAEKKLREALEEKVAAYGQLIDAEANRTALMEKQRDENADRVRVLEARLRELEKGQANL